MAAEPIEHRRHLRRGALGLLAALRHLPAADPAGELAFEIPFRAAEIVKPDIGRRNEVQIGQRIDQRETDATVELGPAGELIWDVVADHKAVPPFLDDEDRADDALVLAQ